MITARFRNRRAAQLENGKLRVTILEEGGHVAEILHKESGVNPLWLPPWPSIEPSAYSLAKYPGYGSDSESRLLAGIMGHNLCMDIFGVPSPEEAAAGLTVHGEASIVPYRIDGDASSLVARARLEQAGLQFERRIEIPPEGTRVHFSETVENLVATDRPIGWTQHVTLGPPFLENGVTQFRSTGTRSKVHEGDIAGDKQMQKPGADFEWPFAPTKDGGTQDLRVYTNAPASGGFITTLMNPKKELAYFVAYSPASHVSFAYVWKQRDFPWLGIWEENRSRTIPPWNGVTQTIGMEFGVSPMPETRRQMIERGVLFGAPCFRWIPARGKVHVEYRAFIGPASAIPETVSWDGFGQ